MLASSSSRVLRTTSSSTYGRALVLASASASARSHLLAYSHKHLCRSIASSSGSEANALQVTDPLLIYRAKVARGELQEDEEQLRALIALRRINRSLIDYTPPAHLLGILQTDSQSTSSAALASAIDARLRPGAREFQDSPSSASNQSSISKGSKDDVAELVKWLSESEGLAELGTPKGLLITGTPGTGKSMVMDIFYDSLPTRYKFRRHYHHLLLDLYKIISEEAERRRKAVHQGKPRAPATPEIGTGAHWMRDSKSSGWRRALRGMPFFRPDALADSTSDNMAYIPGPDGDVVKTTLPLHAAARLFLKYGHVLLFDEIQLVDVASAGLLRRTLEAYWRLGGVVVGTSNRIPKDLYASNVQRGQLTQFLEILQERCPNHEMRSNRDFRRQPFYRQQWLDRNAPDQDAASDATSSTRQAEPASAAAPTAAGVSSYFLRFEADKFNALVDDAVARRIPSRATLDVYGRKLVVPRSYAATNSLPSVCRFTFSELCDSPLGPADYLTLASSYHTLIVEDVPQMTLMQKNQARRMITLLDAVYEAGCRLIVLADAAPDDLFFPDAEKAARHAAAGPAAGPEDVRPELAYRNGAGNAAPKSASSLRVDVGQDEFMSDSLIMAETLSEAMQDTEEGFRPNISAYSSSSPSRAATNTDTQIDTKKDKEDKVGFKHLAIFSGEDERFSYQRAVSRLFEMSHPDWLSRKGWRPFLQGEMASWAGATANASAASLADKMPGDDVEVEKRVSSDVAGRFVDPSGDFAEEASYETASFPGRREAQTRLEREMEAWSAKQAQSQLHSEEEAGKIKPNEGERKTSYQADFSAGPIGKKRSRDQGPPVLSEAHVWGVREDWGPKAGAWGKGSSVFSDPASRPSTSNNRQPAKGVAKKRMFSTSALLQARVKPLDHYTVLKVDRSASQAQIKSQFYKLSKQLHPDANPSHDANRRFQEVSEAYAVLGSPASRKSYDGQSAAAAGGAGYGGYGDNVGGGGGGWAYAYDANDNINRRARATYAWDYQRRRKAYARPSSSSSTESAGSTPFGADAWTSSDFSHFETLAAQQRAREERNRARQQGSAAWTSASKEYEADVSNPMVRFAQVVLVMLVVYKAGTFFVGGSPNNANNRRQRQNL